ncbi:MAG: ABC transporter transmembrane domain-containing protein, partial [Planctomycetota bacterium]
MLKRFIKYYRPHRGLFCLTMTAAVIGAVMTVFIPAITRHVLNEAVPNQDFGLILWLLLAILGLVLLSSVLAYTRVKWGHILGVRIEFDMRAELFSHLQKLSFNYFDNVKTGHIMSRISNDLNQIAEIAHHAPEDLLISTSLIIGSFIVMFNISVPLAIIAMIPLPLMIGWGII